MFYTCSGLVIHSLRARRHNVVFINALSCRSILLPERQNDFVNDEGYYNWPFMSVHHWGEDPTGDWKLSIYFSSDAGYVSMTDLAVVLYGTSQIPDTVSRIPEECDSQCVRGCAAQGEEYCDSCRNRRIQSTLRCVSACPGDSKDANQDSENSTSTSDGSDSCAVGGYCLGCQKRLLPLSIPIIVFIIVSGLVLIAGSLSVVYVLWTKFCENHSDYISI